MADTTSGQPTAEAALADLQAGVRSLAAKFRAEAALIRDSTARTVLVQNADLLDHLLLDPDPAVAESRHLLGWARGNLQHHLIFEHGVMPSDVPYDGPLDDLHADAHVRMREEGRTHKTR